MINPNAYESLTYPGEHNMTVHQLVLTRASARNIGTYQCITPFGAAQIYVEMYGEYLVLFSLEVLTHNFPCVVLILKLGYVEKAWFIAGLFSEATDDLL